jgi:lysozyme family protein
MTFEAIGLMTPTQIITDLSDKRLAFLQALPTFATFGLGWSNRVAQVENLAFKMVVR